jgi:hypothetical protein
MVWRGSPEALRPAIGIAVASGRAVGSSVANLAIALARGAGKGRVRQEKGVSAQRNL